MIFVTGDAHGGIDIGKLTSKKFITGNTLTKNDYVIICGDFGFIWKNEPDKTEKYWMKWFNEKPWTTLFIDGNHENHVRLNNYKVEEWNGGKIHKITPSIIHLMRGQIFNIDGQSIFTFGGAQSYDKESRIENISWWAEELPNYKEIQEAIDNLSKVNNKVDFIITHTCPHCISNQMIPGEIDADPTAKIMDEFYKTIDYKAWFFGHWHVDKEYNDNHVCCYDNIYQLE